MASQQLIKRLRQQQQQSSNGLWLRRHEKKQELVVVEEESNNTSERRSWADMDHNILVTIMKRLSWMEWAFVVCYVCKSWLLALLEALFPPHRVLDLRPIDSIPKENKSFRRRFRHYIKLVLDRRPPTQYLRVIFARSPFNEEAYVYIAQRLPSLNSCISLSGPKIDYISKCLPYWKNLEKIHCCALSVEYLGAYYKCLHTLSLIGQIGHERASLIAGNFPVLRHLVIQYCAVSVDALSIILDSHKNLTFLNTEHCYRFEKTCRNHTQL